MHRRISPNTQAAASLAACGMTTREIGAELGISHTLAHRWLLQVGVKTMHKRGGKQVARQAIRGVKPRANDPFGLAG
jgi:orotate phosphoribosyltransferase-like protein